MLQRGRQSTASLSVAPLQSYGNQLSPPAELSAPEKQVFKEIVSSVSRDHFAPSDTFLIGAYAQAVVAARTFAKQLSRRPELTDRWAQAVKVQGIIATKLRLAPQSRYDALRAGRRGKQAKQTASAYDHIELED
jgi:hypothetical protein